MPLTWISWDACSSNWSLLCSDLGMADELVGSQMIVGS